ncbi:cubilin-like, partial [Brevipalpus obovatus]|uniref:cubilin-like n=1 Tax=Brevipalpus obovatus TaxID=246614 RepID=UPI003D9EB87F
IPCFLPSLLDHNDFRPRVRVEDGNIVFESPPRKRIEFKSESGQISVNGKSLISLSNSGQYPSVDQRNSPILSTSDTFSPNLATRFGLLSQKVDQLGLYLQNLSQIAGRARRLFTDGSVTYKPRHYRNVLKNFPQLQKELQDLNTLIIKNECQPNPCKNGATCIDEFNDYQCLCTNGFDGRNCDNDVDECAVFANSELGCQNGGTCINLPGSYRCECPPNFYGIHCTTDHDDCASSSNEALCGHGICVDLPRKEKYKSKYRCICDQGWTVAETSTNPSCTKDINECETGAHHCSLDPPVECINRLGSFECGPCPAGYTKQGSKCVDINECMVNNGGCSMSPLVRCINTRGSVLCGQCPPGFVGDGKTCTLRGICAINNGGCHPLATCQQDAASSMMGTLAHECVCPMGYRGNGRGPGGCQLVIDLGGSTPQPCGAATCVNGDCVSDSTGIPRCNCREGWEGSACERMVSSNRCTSTTCLNGGTCISSQEARLYCLCPDEYTGERCEIQRENCGAFFLNPLVNGTVKYPLAANTPYSGNQDCRWRLTVRANKVVQMNFTEFNLENSPGCHADYVEIYDGPRQNPHSLLGRFCGDNSSLPNNGSVTSLRNHVLILFHSDATDQGDGFTLNWQAINPVCGGVRNNSLYGVVQSPGFDTGNYPAFRDCYWYISAPFGKRLQLSFAMMALENHDSCAYDFVKIYDGPSLEDPLLAVYCNYSSPPPISSSGHSIVIHFHSDAGVIMRGFSLTYTAIAGIPGCDDTYTGAKGVIQSPNFPQKYDRNLDCQYLIRIKSPNEKIELVFNSLDMEPHPICKHDYVEIYDGSDTSSPLKGRWCSNVNKPKDPIISSKNTMLVRFRSDWSREGFGFRAEYRIYCGGVYTGETGLIKSPNYPYAYPGSRTCTYHIRLPPQPARAIKLQFLSLDIEQQSDCVFDRIVLSEPHVENATEYPRICGTRPPDPIITEQNELTINFTTDGSRENRGFLLNYSSIAVDCGGVMRENHGTIAFPITGHVYPPEKTCNWIIIAPRGFIVQLAFTLFHLEEPSMGSKCRYDFVKIFDGDTVLGPYCGTRQPPSVRSRNEELRVMFKSDKSNQLQGFIASYSFLNQSSFCGGLRTGLSGEIETQHPYGHRQTCTWTISAPSSRKIHLNFTRFELESQTDCRFDSLTIYNGPSTLSPKIGTFCGNKIPTNMISRSSELLLVFKTDTGVSRYGFKVLWDAMTQGCGSLETRASGTIQSPRYPEPYPDGIECVFHIKIARGSRVKLDFTEIDLEPNDGCRHDWVKVLDGPTIRSPLMLKACQNLASHRELISKSNTMTIMMRSDQSLATKGFHARYWDICDTNITGTHGVIESPNHPDDYPRFFNCSWIINAPRGNKIRINFASLSLASPCSQNYIEIIDVDYKRSFCGNQSVSLARFNSSSERLKINFISNNTESSTTASGFRLEWRTFGCGEQLFTGPRGTITSPNYPNSYKNAITCHYHIRLEPGNQIKLDIQDVDIEDHRDCKFDYLKFYSGPDASGPLLTTICGKTSSRSLTAHGNELTVVFVADATQSGRGFRLIYSSRPGSCGGFVSLDKGTLQWPPVGTNTDLTSDKNDVCQWHVSSPRWDMRLQFTIEEINIPKTENCSSSYLEISDGRMRNLLFMNSLRVSKIRLEPPAEEEENVSDFTFCGTKADVKVNPVLLNTSTALVRMKNDGIHDSSFKLSFTAVCGGTIDLHQQHGTKFLFSPGFPALRKDDQTCTWLIKASQPDQKIRLTLGYMSSITENCNDNFIEIRDGQEQESPLVGKYCGAKVPRPIISSGDSLWVFKSRGLAFRMFVNSENSPSCNAIYEALSGSFISPGFVQRSYPINIDCYWRIEVAKGNRISLTFDDFDLEESEFCSLDYLEIRETGMSGPLIGRFCGHDKPALNQTAFQSVWIRMKTDSTGTAPGFALTWTTLSEVDLTGESGSIQSPGYPNYMHLPVKMKYKIIAPINQIILFRFTEIDIPINSTSQCRYYVTIRDGYTEGAPNLGTFCGYLVQDEIRTTSNIAQVDFVAAEGASFVLSWKAELPNDTDSAPFPIPSTQKGRRGWSRVTLKQGVNTSIVSPGYPLGYENDFKYRWFIRSPFGMHAYFVVQDMNLEDGNCADNITFSQYNYFAQSWEENRTVCERQTPQFSIANSLALMTFSTDYYYNRTGFNITAFPRCGSTFKIRLNHTIDSKLLGNETECEWTIIGREGRTIQLNFTRFYVGVDQTPCTDSYISIKNGFWPNSPPLGKVKYCGSRSQAIPESSSNYVHIIVKAPVGSHVDFALKFVEKSAECGGRIELGTENLSTTISSPKYPDPPPHSMECEWLIIGPSQRTLRFDPSISSVIECNKTQTFVAVHDGGTNLAPLLNEYCPQSRASGIESSENMMYVRYVVSGDLSHSAFKADVSLTECGGTYHVLYSFKITSKNYPNNYDDNLNCVYKIHASQPTRVLSFNILNLDLIGNANSNCESGDYIEMRADSAEGTKIGRYCGFSNTSSTIDAGSDVIYMVFKTDGQNTGKGFEIQFYNSYESCGYTLLSISDPIASGEISSPRFPRGYPAPRSCHWYLEANQGNHYELQFLQYNLKSDPRAPGKCLDNLIARVIPPFGTHSFSRLDREMIDKYVIPFPCNGSVPPTFVSPSDTVVLEFETKSLAPGEGFKLSYQKVPSSPCGGPINHQNKEFQSANFDAPTNGQIIYCLWKLEIRRNNVSIALFYKNIEIQGTPSDEDSCSDFFMMEQKSAFSLDGQKKTYCGNQTNVYSYITKYTYNDYTYLISAKLNRSSGYRGIKGELRTFDCGGVVYAPANLTSPNYPQEYPQDFYCSWLFLTDLDFAVIQVTFLDFQLEEDPECSRDFVEIRAGEYPNSPLIGRYCGSKEVATVNTYSHAVSIIFRSNSHQSGRGFNLKLEKVSKQCGGLVHGLDFLSPGYPESYAKDIECIWRLGIEPGYHMRIYFDDRFEIQQSQNCTKDYILISEATSENTFMDRYRFCGLVKPKSFDLESNKALVTFRSNSDDVRGAGFLARILRLFVITSGSGTIQTPNYPYPIANVECSYEFKILSNDFIRIEYIDFDLESSFECKYDSLIIFIGGNETDESQQLGPYCGGETPETLSTRGNVTLKISTDSLEGGRGIKFKYNIIACGGNFTLDEKNSSILLTSPNLNGKYLPNVNCVYEIKAPPQYVLLLRFQHFKLYQTDTCYTPYYPGFGIFQSGVDQLDVYDGSLFSKNVTIIRRLCGLVFPPTIKSSSNIMSLVFASNEDRSESDGFVASVSLTFGPKQGCGGLFNASSGMLSPPAGVFNSSLDCIWYVMSADDKKIVKLSYTPGNIVNGLKITGNRSACDIMYFEIRDGLTQNDPLLYTICPDMSAELTLRSSSSQVYVHFHRSALTQELINLETSRLNPFLNYEFLDPICGGAIRLTNETVTIHSPNFPKPYPPSTPCTWTIESQHQYYLTSRIRFTDLSIDCEHGDFLEATGYYGYQKIHRLCGISSLPVIESVWPMKLFFRSGPEESFHHGFEATIEVVSSCNQIFTEESGVILSDSYPFENHFDSLKSSSDKTCDFNITVPVGRKITIYFHEFEFTTSSGTEKPRSSCPSDSYMEVRGGDSTNITVPASGEEWPQIPMKSMGKYCGKSLPRPIFSETNFLQFSVRGAVYKYSLLYSSTDKKAGCGGNITAINGTFTSPNYPGPSTDDDCVWNVRSHGLHTLTLKFAEFELSSTHTRGCEDNFLEIYEGSKVINEGYALRLCGDDNPSPYVSKGNILTVRLKTNTANTDVGFRIEYSVNEIDLSPRNTIVQVDPIRVYGETPDIMLDHLRNI